MSKRMRLLVLVLVGCGIVATGQAQQFIYKWNDEQGQIQYSELPPPSGVPYETVRKPAGFGQESGQARDLAKEQEELAKNWPRKKPRHSSSSKNRRGRRRMCAPRTARSPRKCGNAAERPGGGQDRCAG